MNPSDVWFFRPLIKELCDCKLKVTLRDRAETVALARSSDIDGEVVGAHYTDRVRKNIGSPLRYARLYFKVRDYDIGLFFENGPAVMVCRLKGKPSILFCDNDLKMIDSGSVLQDIENKLKFNADYLVVPAAAKEIFGRFCQEHRIIAYDGYKEDVYIADFQPDPDFHEKVPFDDFVVVRGEALDSSYVGDATTIVPELIKALQREGLQVVFLPREKYDTKHAEGLDVFIPKEPLNGLDLCYYARAVLTGSGTMAREAACMGKPAISFFPGRQLLSVDRKLVDEGRMMHSRNPAWLARHVASLASTRPVATFERSKVVKRSLMADIRRIIDSIRSS